MYKREKKLILLHVDTWNNRKYLITAVLAKFLCLCIFLILYLFWHFLISTKIFNKNYLIIMYNMCQMCYNIQSFDPPFLFTSVKKVCKTRVYFCQNIFNDVSLAVLNNGTQS